MDAVSRVFLLHQFASVNWPLSPLLSSQEFEFEDGEVLCDKLSALATDCNKHRTKVDKRKQRSVFRDVLRAVEVSQRPAAPQ